MSQIIYNKHSQDLVTNLTDGVKDLFSGIKNWRIYCLIGIMDIKKRYIRSKLGQFWLTLSLGINIATLGIIWGYLFKIDLKDYLPYIAISSIFWNFISTNIVEGSGTYINFTSYLKELNIGKSTYIFSLLIKNLIILGHNLIILIPLAFFCNFNISFSGLIFTCIGIILTILFIFPLILFISTVSLRFRDLPNIITSIIQILFYATPIMWKIELMPERLHKFILLNPFTIFLTLCRDPFFLKYKFPYEYWLIALFYILLSWLVGFTFFCKYRNRIIYWL